MPKQTNAEMSTATRGALVEAGVKLFEERGFASTSVQAIAEEAGLTKGAFYHHFETKEQLLAVIHTEFIDDQLERVERVLDQGDDVVTTLRAVVVELIRSLEFHQDKLTIFYRERRELSGELLSDTVQKRDRFEHLITDLIDRGVAEGSLRHHGPSKMVAFALFGMFAYTIEWYSPTGPMTPQEIADVFIPLIFEGLVVDRP